MIFQFVTQEELEALPHDQPPAAFSQLVRIATARFEDTWRSFENNSDVAEYQYDFQTVILAAADRYGIREMNGLEPSDSENYSYQEFRRFRVKLNRVVSDLAIESAQRPGWASVYIPSSSRRTIMQRLEALRKAVENDAAIPPSVRARLQRELNSFEKSLNQRRFELVHLALLSMTIATIPGGIGDTVRTFGDIAHIIQDAYADEQDRTVPNSPSIALPQSPGLPLLKASHGYRPPAFGSSDDDIPF